MSLNLNNSNDIICNSLKLIENGALVDINDKITSGSGYTQSEADVLFYTKTYLNTQLGLKANTSTLTNYMLTTDINTALALKANQVDLTATSNSVTNNIALISALQTKTATIENPWSISSSYSAFFNPSVTQTGGNDYCLIHKTDGHTYLNSSGNTDIMVSDVGKIRMTSTTTTMDTTNTYIRTGGNDCFVATASKTEVDGVNGVDILANNVTKVAVGTSLIALSDQVDVKDGLLIRGKIEDMVSSGYRQIRFVNPYGGNTSTDNSWSFGNQNDAPTSSDNDFYFEVTRDGTSTIVAYLQDSDLNEELDFTGQHRCLFQGNYNDNMVGLIVSSTGALFNLNGSDTPKINESIPKVTLSSTAKDKTIFGVISGKESEENTRKYKQGNFTSVLQKQDNTNRIYVNSLGEGAIWVCNEGSSDIQNGDYVCSSSLSGYGKKQDDDVLHNYTVAKLTQNVDFSNSNSITLPNGNKAMFVSCTYHCG